MSSFFYLKSRILKFTTFIISVFLWLVIWEFSSYLLDLEFIFPGAIQTFKTLASLVVTFSFWKTVFMSVFRILLGFIIGILVGIALSFMCEISRSVCTFVTIGMTVIKSTPVASIIMVMWVIIGSSWLPIIIALLMVAPIIWQNLMDGFMAIDKNLSEVCSVFEFSKIKKFKMLVYPALMKFFVPAALTSIGLAWKSGIAAEIIAYTKISIGKSIFDAKNYFEGDVMFAWTVTLVVISLIFECLIKYLLRRFSENESLNSKRHKVF